ncbi:MAG: patatin family protein [Clostridia bacterium]|nr:patatin family protein [Clostridia bacterium]
MTGIVDAGGGMRGVYSSGVYDYLMDNGISVDLCIGVSAGSANLITYIASQKRRTLDFYREYPKRKEYMSFGNFLTCGSYIDLDYIYSDLSNSDGENPLDFAAALRSDIKFLAVATNSADGRAEYFTKADMKQDDYTVLKASCCMPGICKPVGMGGQLYVDGGVADPIPVEKAFSEGCDKVIIVLTKPREDYCRPLFATKVLSLRLRKYPEVLKLMKSLHRRCGEIFEKIAEWEKEGKVLVVEPSELHGMTTLNTDSEAIFRLYEQGYEDARKIKEFI